MLDDVSGSRRQPNAARLAPDGPINFLSIADLQRARRLSDDEDSIAHLSTGATILGGNFFPEAYASQSEVGQFFLNFSAQAIFLGLSAPLATAGKHPQPIAFSPNQQDLSALHRDEL